MQQQRQQQDDHGHPSVRKDEMSRGRSVQPRHKQERQKSTEKTSPWIIYIQQASPFPCWVQAKRGPLNEQPTKKKAQPSPAISGTSYWLISG
eukprot:1152488-Pelagomonas_calceolata.AAC.10